MNADALSSRVIDAFPADGFAPRLVIFAGVHGNEPSGVVALQRVFEQLRTQRVPLRGQLVGVLGNLEALRKQARFLNEDLNRLFLPAYIEQVKAIPSGHATEARELLDICQLVESLEAKAEGPLFFVDCHTTSSDSIPFISLNEGFASSLHFAHRIPAASVVGAEKEIRGCLSEWLNKRGWTGFTFEAGQHLAAPSIENQEAMIWLALLHSGCLDQGQAHPWIERARATLLQQGKQQRQVYQLKSAYRIQEGENFRMKPGFVNLQFVQQGEHLADSDGQAVLASEDAHLLMPLYQLQGNFGFFLVQEVPFPPPAR